MNTYFVSQYLNVIELETSSLLFNGANGVMDEVSSALGNKLRVPRIPVDVSNMSESEIHYLKKRGHITSLSQEEEIATFTHIVKSLRHYEQERAKKQGYIMLLLSYNCNLDCYYCYQREIRRQNKKHNRTQVMSPTFVEEIFTQHFESFFPGVPYKNVRIVLYGGEPFLLQHSKTIKRILEFTRNTPFEVVSAITNGTQVDTMLDFFGPLPGQVNSVQISLDGTQEFHDHSRISASKKPTFHKIIENIHRLLDKKVRINLRINLSKENIYKLKELTDFLKEQDFLGHPLLYPYLHPIHIHYDQTDEDELLSIDKLSDYLLSSTISEYIRTPAIRKADRYRQLLSLQNGSTGLTMASFCMISTENYIIIDPHGDIYKCYEEAGREEYKLGEIRNRQIQWFKSELETYLSRDVSTIIPCSTCSVALACGGECAAQARAKYHNFFAAYCNNSKFMILDAIKHLYQEQVKDVHQDNMDINLPNL
ncbi:radical SAM domain protein [Candidatus Vecturithrix granuli]|uniref:Radical SAM domain protein n=1 Tax=Vecturithrix granuli TaxID=1499967 RepID=A0A081C7J3_VECG1|nr:radical SAM domain protein [Candidatus Vecturithrix granuli]